MSYLILCDSCTDFTDEMKQDSHFTHIPLTIHIGDYDIVDDDTFDQKDFLQRIDAYPECAKSSCPGPEEYSKHFERADDIYVVTLSSHLSGSYNSAVLAANMYCEEHPEKRIHVFDSLSASAGQTLIALKIQEYAEANYSREKIIEQTENFIHEMGTKFVLESLETLRKNGRLSTLTATIASALNIKPVMTSNGNGEIDKVTQARGMTKAIIKMADAIKEDAINSKEKILMIAHCNNKERAEFAKQEILKRLPFKDVKITDTGGISSLYAANGGIVICY
ncbi:MAG: DegV family protein [Lachnospiraceae bacterium]|nr:DegV family protein [Lachnospiraceae bacterium]